MNTGLGLKIKGTHRLVYGDVNLLGDKCHREKQTD
jgi:hypothetical protein